MSFFELRIEMFIAFQAVIWISSVMGGPSAGLFKPDLNSPTLKFKTGEKVSAFPCPDDDQITPCTCTVTTEHKMTLDCSAVESETQMRTILNRDFPFTNFETLLIRSSPFIKALREGDLGKLSFRNVRIEGCSLISLQASALSNSYNILNSLALPDNVLGSAPNISLFKNLTSFDISGNGLTDFPALNSTSLEELNLGRNALIEIPTKALANLPSLAAVYIDDCSISQIHPGTFTGLANLQTLHLNGNKLVALPRSAIELRGPSGNLRLQNNHISTLANGSFTGAKGWLNASNNSLKVLDEQLFRPVLEANGFLYIEGNPFTCGCDIAWLILNQTLLNLVTDNPKCDTNVSFRDLDPSIYKDLCS